MLIQKISSILKTWVFRKKILKFSDKYPKDPMACFYCPELCRFSCPVTETLRDDTVTPRGKMSLLHLANMGVPNEKVTASNDQWLWTVSQCTGCGRCTEYCLYEIDVAKNLREARRDFYTESKGLAAPLPATALSDLQKVFEINLEGSNQSADSSLILAQDTRQEWWKKITDQSSKFAAGEVEKSARFMQRFSDLQGQAVLGFALPHRAWARGTLTADELKIFAQNLKAELTRFKKSKQVDVRVWVESPEELWFLVQLQKEDPTALKGFLFRPLWQAFYKEFLHAFDAEPNERTASWTLHESYFLSRLLPREGISNPVFEKGLVPIHHSWNVLDCGGEGHYQEDFSQNADRMREKFLFDLSKTGKVPTNIICQSLACADHLHGAPFTTSYWLDFVWERSSI